MSNFTLRELSEYYQNIFYLACEEDDSEDLEKALDTIDEAIEKKADSYAVILSEMKSKSDLLSDEIRRLQGKKRTIENNQRRLKENLEFHMNQVGKRKFKTDYYSFNIQKNPARVVIDDPMKLDEKYMIIKKEPDKQAIKDVLKTGEVVEGAHLEQSEGVRIR